MWPVDGFETRTASRVLACVLGRRNKLCHSSLGCMGVVASFHLRDDLLAVLSHLEPSESGQVTRVPRLALGLEVFLVGFGPVLLGSFTETWSGTAPSNQRPPLCKAIPYGCWRNTEGVVAALTKSA